MTSAKLPRLLIVAAIFAAFAWLIVSPAPRLSLDGADGTYTNACCQPLILRNGWMAVGKEAVRYRIETDKEGAYLLPDSYVGIAGGTNEPPAFDVGRHGVPLKLRLDNPDHPATITLFDDAAPSEYVFVRHPTG